METSEGAESLPPSTFAVTFTVVVGCFGSLLVITSDWLAVPDSVGLNRIEIGALAPGAIEKCPTPEMVNGAARLPSVTDSDAVRLRLRTVSVFIEPGRPVAVAGKLSVEGTLR